MANITMKPKPGDSAERFIKRFFVATDTFTVYYRNIYVKYQLLTQCYRHSKFLD